MGIPTGLHDCICSFVRMLSMNLVWHMFIIFLGRLHVISMLMIFFGSPKSVMSNLPFSCFFSSSISLRVFANSNRSSTHTVMISIPFVVFLMYYMHGSDLSGLNPMLVSLVFNSMFHSRSDCFKPYSVFLSRHTQPVPSSNPSGCAM